MQTQTFDYARPQTAPAEQIGPTAFEHFGSVCAAATALFGLLYSISFVIIARLNPAVGGLLSALFLLLGGLAGSAALTALYSRLLQSARVEPGFAFWGLLLGLVAAGGVIAHGGYDLANTIHPAAANLPALTDLPNPIDPRGLLTFGLAGLAMLVLNLLVRRDESFPTGLGLLGLALGILMIVTYLGRLIFLSPAHPLVIGPAVLAGFIANPLWYIWLAFSLRRGR
jgi:hypothetical protein